MESIGKILTASWVIVGAIILYFKRSTLGELSLNEWGGLSSRNYSSNRLSLALHWLFTTKERTRK
ncbi:TPA: hypothetical protein NGV38_004645 [Vibrio parahaemolyticus]|nr:hypothetical protein [Vibrio parahaemolyticus]EJL7824539.1 hypothetical protein [Vibrio parahaemolyticus]HCE2913207.1 hypothetical protein [Vibrio parahaemolyticus]